MLVDLLVTNLYELCIHERENLLIHTRPTYSRGCKYCKIAKGKLAELGVPYTEIDVTENPDDPNSGGILLMHADFSAGLI